MDKSARLGHLRNKLVRIAQSEQFDAVLSSRSKRPPPAISLENATRSRVIEPVLDHLVIGAARRTEEDEFRTLRKLSNGDFDAISARETLLLEAIVEETGRPVSFVLGGKFENLSEPWTRYNEDPIRTRIEAAIPAVGRVEAAGVGIPPAHVGTGFIVGRDLMMTNRHVAELFVRGVGAEGLSFVPQTTRQIDFGCEKGFVRDDSSASIVIKDIVMVHPYWDMALLKVAGLPDGIKPLSLGVKAPEDMAHQEIAVIGYPARSRDRSPEAVRLERSLFGDTFGVKRLAPGELLGRDKVLSFNHRVPALAHDSSTLPGNSGAALIDIDADNRGEVIGLHFAGITLEANFAVPTFELARDRRVVDAGVNFVATVPATDAWESFWKAADSNSESAGGFTFVATHSCAPSTSNNTVTVTIPLTLSLSFGGEAVSATPTRVSSVPGPSIMEMAYQMPIIHANLPDRVGYDPDFLGAGDEARVPLPAISSEGEQEVSRLDDGTCLLHYHHFSVVMHRIRRLALFTAANVSWRQVDRLIDGRKPTRGELTGIPKGVAEEWVNDPRIPDEDQLPDIFFTKDGGAFDKGHVVRRDDVVWGDTFEEMQRANGDTFHVTNCSPQVLGFNRSSRGKDNWGDLENLVQKQAKGDRVCVFAGPVLSHFDPIFKGIDASGPQKIQIPTRFWKIIVGNTDDGLRAFGLVLEQKLEGVSLEFAIPEDWAPFQKTIDDIQTLAGDRIDFSWFARRDIMNRT